ncbi:GNAT family N-acetyltransferase [Roseibium sp.]|uniref:GNAT family N-acetyltransferase n=1 Tax=Roseibium sp. TaxID=1936156 RepID=UPI003A985D92
MDSLLNRPIWTALESRMNAFAVKNRAAARFHPETSPFACAMDGTAQSSDDLAALLTDDTDRLVFLQAEPIRLPDALETVEATDGVQLVLRKDLPEPKAGHLAERLGTRDIPEMIALAELTKPGPFRARTIELGEYWGIRIDGRLAAMTGERLTMPGLTEISAVCTHPDFQGRGFAASLSVHVARRIIERGDTPFLHAFSTNTGAIRLYERLGFVKRANMNVAVVKRAT